ncbi:MAG TPA: hypothetical protein VKT77_03525 [Chthonomonadaceae bacterium]|nr:hypothetical protein [Chthonomonadaceae bacterium]
MRFRIEAMRTLGLIAGLCAAVAAGAAPEGSRTAAASLFRPAPAARLTAQSADGLTVAGVAVSSAARRRGAGRSPDKAPAAPADDGLDSRRWTLWIGGPLELDYRPGNTGAITIAAGLGGALAREDDGFGDKQTTLKFGPLGEVYYYPNRRASGLAFNLRVGSADGVYVAPGIYYVSRPKGSVCGRFGICAPIGGNTIPVNPEVALGVRF